jgi:hypothetical protein
MKLNLVFKNSGDVITYDVIHNYKLLEFFIDKCNSSNSNSFQNFSNLSDTIDRRLTEIHWAVTKTNEVLPSLIRKKFDDNLNLLEYLNQDFLNKQHYEWVISQQEYVNIDLLRFSSDINKARLGAKLHELYPDDIRRVKIAPALANLGYIFPYEEVNLTVHRLESSFNRLEYSADNKWDVFDNPFTDCYSANDITNFSFSYTYVGRQYYDKFKNFDDDLKFLDHYNYETLEYSFHLSLQKPESIPFSNEFIQWTERHNIPKITSSLPVAILPDISEKLFEYRKMLYRNAKNKNPIVLEIV